MGGGHGERVVDRWGGEPRSLRLLGRPVQQKYGRGQIQEEKKDEETTPSTLRVPSSSRGSSLKNRIQKEVGEKVDQTETS